MKRGIFLPRKLRQIFTKLLEENCIFIGTGHSIRIAKAINRCFNPKNEPESECMSLTAGLTMNGYFDSRAMILFQYLVNCCSVKITKEEYLRKFKLAMEAYNQYCNVNKDIGRMDSFHYGSWRGMTVIINGTNRGEIMARLSITQQEYDRDFKFVTMGALPVSFDVLNVVLQHPYQVFQIIDRYQGNRIDLSIDRELIEKYFKGVVACEK